MNENLRDVNMSIDEQRFKSIDDKIAFNYTTIKEQMLKIEMAAIAKNKEFIEQAVKLGVLESNSATQGKDLTFLKGLVWKIVLSSSLIGALSGKLIEVLNK